MSDFLISSDNEGVRLDIYMAKELDLTRSRVQSCIDDGFITVNSQKKPKRYEIKAGDVISCNIPMPEVYRALPEAMELDIVYEDKDVIIINKPQGLVVHPAPGHLSGTLVNGLLHHCKDLSGVNGVLRPGIVHRLDKDTSGLIAVAKHDKAHNGLAEQLASRTMKRVYYGLVYGLVKQDEFTVNRNIGRHWSDRKKMAVLQDGKGKTAVTHIKVLERYTKTTLIEASLETGRTHQIRVHMAYAGYPIVEDPVYGRDKDKGKGQLLHSKKLSFIHPILGEKMSFEVELPSWRQI